MSNLVEIEADASDSDDDMKQDANDGQSENQLDGDFIVNGEDVELRQRRRRKRLRKRNRDVYDPDDLQLVQEGMNNKNDNSEDELEQKSKKLKFDVGTNQEQEASDQEDVSPYEEEELRRKEAEDDARISQNENLTSLFGLSDDDDDQLEDEITATEAAEDLAELDNKANFFSHDRPERRLRELYNSGIRELHPDIFEANRDSELDLETKWILDQCRELRNQNADETEFETSVKTTVKLARFDHLEAAYIYTYERDQIGNENLLTADQVIAIVAWSNKWTILQSRKKAVDNLLDKLESISRSELKDEVYYLRQGLQESKDIEEVADIQDEIQMLLSPYGEAAAKYDHMQMFGDDGDDDLIPTKRKKRGQSRFQSYMLYRKYIKSLLDSEHLGISVAQLAHNFYLGRQYHKHHGAKSETFEQAVNTCICPELSTAERVISVFQHVLTLEIYTNACIRKHFKSYVLRECRVYTKPTPKGMEELDQLHSLYRARRVINKPLDKFVDDHWLIIVEAKNMGLVNVSFKFTSSISQSDQHKFNSFLRLFQKYFCSGLNDSWDEARDKILKRALLKFDSLADQYVEAELTARASEFVCAAASAALQQRVSVLPYKFKNRSKEQDDDDKRNLPKRIFSITVARFNSQEPSVVAVLNEHGVLVESMNLKWLTQRGRGRRDGPTEEERTLMDRKRNEKKELFAMLNKFKPDIILIDASHVDSQIFSSNLKDEILKFEYPDLPVRLVHPEIGRIFSKSSRGDITDGPEFKNYSVALRQAISLGRFVLHPLAETCAMLAGPIDDVLSLQLHPRQSMIERSALLAALEKKVESLVNAVGVDLNNVLNHKHQADMLQFVAGLGPASAKALLTTLKRSGESNSRDHISKALPYPVNTEKPFSNVFINCAGFIRVSSRSRDTTPNLLDLTRIHPNAYFFAYEIVRSALDDTDLAADEEERVRGLKDLAKKFLKENKSSIVKDGSKAVNSLFKIEDNEENETEKERRLKKNMLLLEILRHDDNPQKMDSLNFDDHHKRKKIAELICAEIKVPFGLISNDNFREFGELSDEDMFYLLSAGDTRETLFKGALVDVEAVALQPTGVRCKFDNGFWGKISIKNICNDDILGDRDVKKNEETEIIAKYIKTGQWRKARVLDINYRTLHLELSTAARDVDDTDRRWCRLLEERYEADWSYMHLEHTGPHEEDEKYKALMKTRDQETYVRRNIVHPLFKNCGTKDGVDYLNMKKDGEFLFHPSRNYSSLVALLRIDVDVFMKIPIQEGKKLSSNQSSLGSPLTVFGENFEDLDHVAESGPLENVISTLQRPIIRGAEPGSASYFLSFDMKPHSEMPKVHFLTTIVWFSYISKDVGVRSEKARISLQGYFISLNGKEQKVSRPEKLIQAFKAKSSSAVRNQLRAGSKASQRSRHQKRSENSQEQKHRDRQHERSNREQKSTRQQEQKKNTGPVGRPGL